MREIADPERALAVAYAPREAQPALAAIFALDERFGAIVAATTEPVIGMMRLAWWREALERLDQSAPPAEPLLHLIAAEALPRGLTGAMLAEIEHGWSALLDGSEGESLVERHGAARGRHLFACAARALGSDDPRLRPAGEGWALADLACRHSLTVVRTAARARARVVLAGLPRGRWRPDARPLAALTVLAARDAAMGERRQGSPARLARMLALRLTGR